jgi:hypothetical protein
MTPSHRDQGHAMLDEKPKPMDPREDLDRNRTSMAGW